MLHSLHSCWLSCRSPIETLLLIDAGNMMEEHLLCTLEETSSQQEGKYIYLISGYHVYTTISVLRFFDHWHSWVVYIAFPRTLFCSFFSVRVLLSSRNIGLSRSILIRIFVIPSVYSQNVTKELIWIPSKQSTKWAGERMWIAIPYFLLIFLFHTSYN